MVRTLEQSGQARLGTRPASLRFSVYPKQIIDNTMDQIYLGRPIPNDTPGGALLFESLVFPLRGQKSMAPQVSEAGT